SALMQDEPLFAAILEAVVRAVGVPVALQTRLGRHDRYKNLPAVSRIAEDCGIAPLPVHRRTRTQMYKGDARYQTIAITKNTLK
ncbi:tRNA-dihydrouridine synthase, partial [Neisseria meningitidis]|uniref:tRNA-dihydrouridine synthase n=1 Tax=Neisseria meningitidis TaxID=487 RepID=UPI000CC3CF00